MTSKKMTVAAALLAALVVATISPGAWATPSQADVGAIKTILAGAVGAAELERVQIRRSLKQLQMPAFNFASGGGGQGFLDLMGGARGANPNLFPMDPAAIGQVLSESSHLAAEACNPAVLASMTTGLGSMMLPPNAQEMYKNFCKMVPKSAQASQAPQFPSANILGMLGPQLSQFGQEVPMQDPSAGGSNLVASLLGLNGTPFESFGETFPEEDVTFPQDQEEEEDSVPALETAALPANLTSLASAKSLASNATSADKGATSAAAEASGAPDVVADEDRTGMDYISPLGMPDLSQMMNYGEIFAFEQKLPSLLDGLIDDAWEEMGTEEQAYAARHAPPPLPERWEHVLPVDPHNPPRAAAAVESFVVANPIDEETLMHIIDSVDLVAKRAREPTGAATSAEQIFRVAGTPATPSAKKDEAAGAQNRSGGDDGGAVEAEPDLETTVEAEASYINKELMKDDMTDILTALFVCAIFVALVAVTVSVVSAFKVCSNNINESRYQQTYDSDLPSERKFLKPLFSGRSQRSDTQAIPA